MIYPSITVQGIICCSGVALAVMGAVGLCRTSVSSAVVAPPRPAPLCRRCSTSSSLIAFIFPKVIAGFFSVVLGVVLILLRYRERGARLRAARFRQQYLDCRAGDGGVGGIGGVLIVVNRVGRPMTFVQAAGATFIVNGAVDLFIELAATDYITDCGNDNVVLCERGIRTFETATRFTLDIAAVPVIHKESLYPVCIDVSHPAGQRDLVPALAKAAVAAGADSLMIEVHPNPPVALSDGPQQLTPAQFRELIAELRELAACLGKKIV